MTGPGGVGKTRLALATAEAVADLFDDGVFFVDLATVTAPSLVVWAIADALGLREAGECAREEQLCRELRDKCTLIVLDNFEQVVEAAPSLANLLGRTSSLKLLVTSRRILHAGWEHEFPVPPLALPDAAAGSPLEAAQTSPAVTLFVDRARAVAPDFRLHSGNARTVTEICSRLDGLPLAIELAAARIKLLSPATMLAWLQGESGRSPFHVLTTERQGLPPRQHTLWAEIDWSYQLLSPSEQAFFRRLAVLVGDFSLEAAELVAGAGPDDSSGDPTTRGTLDLLESLLDKSMLVRRGPNASTPARIDRLLPTSKGNVWTEGRLEAVGEEVRGEETRFAMLQTIREYARERLLASAELDSTYRRHATWCLALVEKAEQQLIGAEPVTALDRLEREHDNLRAALAWTVENDPELALRLAGHLWRFWEVRGHFQEGRQWLEAALAHGAAARMDLRAKAWMGAGTMAWRLGDYRSAETYHRESLALYQRLGDLHGVARACNNLGAQAQNLGNRDQATQLLERSLAVARQIGDADVAIMALVNLGTIAMERRDYQVARQRFEEALDLSREVRHARYTAVVLEDLGETLHHLGDLRGALDRLGESLRLAWAIDARGDTAFCLEEMAGLFADLGYPVKAVRLFGAAEAIRDTLGSPVPPAHRVQYYDREVASLRRQLGTATFASAWTDGRRLSARQAVEYALELPGSSPGAKKAAVGTGQSARTASRLTHREREVATLIAHGRTNREIAERLLITEGTAANHVLHILTKLGCHSRAEIAAWAVAQGLRDDFVLESE